MSNEMNNKGFCNIMYYEFDVSNEIKVLKFCNIQLEMSSPFDTTRMLQNFETLIF